MRSLAELVRIKDREGEKEREKETEKELQEW
jgi:hypothetical protein